MDDKPLGACAGVFAAILAAVITAALAAGLCYLLAVCFLGP